MNKAGPTHHRLFGALILERLSGAPTPVAMKGPITAFKKAHADFEAASRTAEAARVARDDALATIGAADEALDAAIARLADALVGAGLGARSNPFAGLGPYAPSALAGLAYAKEVAATRALLAKLAKKKPDARVTKAASACAKQATVVEAALSRLTRPQADYEKALGKRDAMLPSWSKALRALKKHAAAAWDGDDATYRATFAEAEAVQAPADTPKRNKKSTPTRSPDTA